MNLISHVRLCSLLHSAPALTIAATLCLPASAPAQRTNPEMAQLWRNPIFQKQLLGSYGINSDIEPGTTPEEQNYYEQIVPLLSSDPAEAERLLKQLATEEASALFDFTLGNLHFQAGRAREAAAAYKTAIKKFPSFRRAHQNLAIIYVQNERPTEAIEHFTKAIQLGENNGTIYGLLGSAYVMIEDFVAAESAFRTALMLAPDVNDWKLGLVRALLSQGRFAEVASLTSAMLAKDPGNPTLWQLRASAHVGLKDLLKAAADYETLHRIAEPTAESLNTLGDIYVNEEMFDLAAQAYLDAYKLGNPTDIAGPLRAAEILVGREGLAPARDILAQVEVATADKLDPEAKLQILRLKSRIAKAEGRDDEAATMLERIITLDPLDGESLILLGQHYAANSQPDKARFLYERAANLDDFTADANVRLAQLLVSESKYSEAIPLLERAQQIKPRDSVAKFLDDLQRFVKSRR